MMSNKERFIAALAKYMVTDQAYQSIRLETGNPDAKAWAALRNATTPIQGYPTEDEAIADLNRWFATWRP